MSRPSSNLRRKIVLVAVVAAIGAALLAAFPSTAPSEGLLAAAFPVAQAGFARHVVVS